MRYRRLREPPPYDVVLRLLMLEHVRHWSFDTLEREVPANLVYREFTRIGTGKVPDARVVGRIARATGPEVIKQLHSPLGGTFTIQPTARYRETERAP
jgi:IS5 family transposase